MPKLKTTKKLILSQNLKRSPNFELIRQITYSREAISLDILEFGIEAQSYSTGNVTKMRYDKYERIG